LDTLTTRLTEMGLKALDFADKSAQQILEFVQTNAPDVLQEWLTWNLITSILWTIVGIIMLGIFVWFVGHEMKHEWELSEDSEWAILLIVIPDLVIGCILFFSSFMDTLQLIFAPKLWILENIKDLF